MKAPNAQAAEKAASSPGCAFVFWGGLEIIKCILFGTFLKLGFRLGPDLVMLSGMGRAAGAAATNFDC
jgi:hypothetical protein